MKSKFKYFWGLMVFTFFITAYPHLSHSATITYTYDNLNRLTRVVYGDGTTEEFTYDAAGNRLTHVVREPDTTPPSPPQNIQYSSSGFGSIRLSWDPNTDPDLAGYKVYYGKSSGTYENSIDVGNVTAYNLSGLTPGITYYVTITAYDTSGNESLYSMEISGIPRQGLLYDDFSESEIDRSRWREGEYVREISEFASGDYRLYFKTKTPSPIVMTIFPYNTRNNLLFTDPNSVRSIQADVTISENSVTGSARTYAYIGGRFYNDGTAGGGYAGDVWAEVDIRGSSTGLVALYYIGKYTNPEGSIMSDIASGLFTTPISIGSTYTLSVEYDQIAHRFIFKVGSETLIVDSSVLPPRVKDPNMPFKGLLTVARVYNATESASISGTFDNIYKNGIPYDDFSSLIIDSDKWASYEFVREISEGKLRLKARSGLAYTSPVNNVLSFINPMAINNFETKVTLVDYQNPSGLFQVAGISGAFYNDGTPGGGHTGDVVAEVGIGGRETYPVAGWRVYKYTEPSGSAAMAVELASGLFSKPVILGNSYTLSLGWNGSTFTFTFDNEMATYTPTTSINPVNISFKRLRTFIFPEPDKKEATIEALFDDVVINLPMKGIVDFDGDGSTDVAAFHLPSDQFFTDYSGNMGQYGWGGADCYPLAWDYDGDGKTNVSIYHIPTNQWFVKGVPGDNLGAFGWGEDQSVPVPGDYNGDGLMDRAFYHWPTNRWFVEQPDGSFTIYQFGWGGADCIPIAADYDGDGKTDMMLYHLPSNQWFVYGIGNLGQFGWNGAECIPVPGDWNGDGKTEIGIYHWPSNQWVWRDRDGTAHFLGQYGWGGMESFPIPGDYNGDGIMERAFYRPSENRWFIEGEPEFYWGWDGGNFMPITSQMAIYNWFRFVLGKFQ